MGNQPPRRRFRLLRDRTTGRHNKTGHSTKQGVREAGANVNKIEGCHWAISVIGRPLFCLKRCLQYRGRAVADGS